MRKPVRNLLGIAVIAGSLSLVSCREVKEDEPAPPTQNEMREGDMDHHMEDDDPMMDDQAMQRSSAEFQDENTAEAYEHYLAIKTALVQTDGDLAREHAERMMAEVENINEDEDFTNAVETIASTIDVNEQREAFSELTNAMENKLEEAITSGEIYKQYCPMAFEGKGDYWFSDSEQIRNPYFGDKMLKCGRVEETIN